jgi:hypothetical protein
MVHLLIDYESLQPNPLEDWIDKETRVTVFVGAHQHRIPFELASAMQALGKRGRYVKVKHTGKNALDFQLMFYLGELVGQDPGATYRIVSKDTGFDALIDDLRARGLAVERLSLEPAKGQGERRSLADAGNSAASEKPPSRRRVPGPAPAGGKGMRPRRGQSLEQTTDPVTDVGHEEGSASPRL